MIRITASLDIRLIEGLRQSCLGRGLDGLDSYCFHAVMELDERPVGTARLRREGETVVVDEIAVLPELSVEYRELLARSMIARAIDLGGKRVEVRDGADLYTEMGFTPAEGGFFAESAEIIFPGKCRRRE